MRGFWTPKIMNNIYPRGRLREPTRPPVGDPFGTAIYLEGPATLSGGPASCKRRRSGRSGTSAKIGIEVALHMPKIGKFRTLPLIIV